MMPMTNAERQRNWRRRRREAVMAAGRNGPDNIEVVRLAARLGNGAATTDDMRRAERLLLLLVGYLPAAA
jgi:hypothetical protein